ncbi:MAG: hypothetical protein MUO62_04610 [Anaerolineales bacterium]|nr:hypothetical protein [Anaerolineales bacterium]
MNAATNLYARLKIPRVINAAGTLTSLGGCRTRPEVLQAMTQAAGEFVPLAELHQKAGDHLAAVLGVEAAMVTAGAAAGLTLAAAACMAGRDPLIAAGIRSRLPQPPANCKVVIQCSHRNPFERALQLAGATLLQIGDAIRTYPVDLETVLKESGGEIAAVVFFLQAEMLEASLSLNETLEIAHAYQVPVIVDAAAELPPKKNLWSLAQGGSDMVIFSGSKDLRGPQTSGLMVGQRDWIASALRQSAPHEDVIGRPLKAGKEIVAGMLAAVELYLAEDEKIRFAEWERIAKYIEDNLGDVPYLRVSRYTPQQPYIQPAVVPRVTVALDDEAPLSTLVLKTALWKGEPSIATETIGGRLILNTHTLEMPEAELIVRQIKKALSS